MGVHNMFNVEKNPKGYGDKIRSLKYNLERNTELRAQLLQCDIPADNLGK